MIQCFIGNSRLTGRPAVRPFPLCAASLISVTVHMPNLPGSFSTSHPPGKAQTLEASREPGPGGRVTWQDLGLLSRCTAAQLSYNHPESHPRPISGAPVLSPAGVTMSHRELTRGPFYPECSPALQAFMPSASGELDGGGHSPPRAPVDTPWHLSHLLSPPRFSSPSPAASSSGSARSFSPASNILVS